MGRYTNRMAGWENADRQNDGKMGREREIERDRKRKKEREENGERT